MRTDFDESLRVDARVAGLAVAGVLVALAATVHTAPAYSTLATAVLLGAAGIAAVLPFVLRRR